MPILASFLAHSFPMYIWLVIFFFYFLLFETIEVSEYLYLVYCFMVGLVYDIYFFHIIGIATLLFILLGAFLHKLNSVILLNRWTRIFGYDCYEFSI